MARTEAECYPEAYAAARAMGYEHVIDAMLALREEGYQWREVARLLGLTYMTAWGLVRRRRLGLPPVGVKGPRSTIKECELCEDLAACWRSVMGRGPVLCGEGEL